MFAVLFQCVPSRTDSFLPLSCVSGTRVIIQESIYSEFVRLVCPSLTYSHNLYQLTFILLFSPISLRSRSPALSAGWVIVSLLILLPKSESLDG